MAKTDRELGMDRPITRRDFLNGVSLTVGGALVSPDGFDALTRARQQPASAAAATDYYPPAKTGLRGSHPGSFEVAHGLRNGNTWGAGEDTGEVYDLVVVGGGMAGLSAAYYFKKAVGRDAKVLILDNHDDFGGHAKRNEFTVGNRTLLGHGGTQSIEAPNTYTVEGKALLEEIGIDGERFLKATAPDRGLYASMGLRRAVFFDKETFGVDRLVVGVPRFSGSAKPGTWAPFLAKTPLSPTAQRDIVRLYEEPRDYMPGLTPEQKIERLSKISYKDYLLTIANVSPDVLPFFQQSSLGWPNGAGDIDSYSAWGCFRLDRFPGLDGLGLGERPAESYVEQTGTNIHFPDGNGSVARLLVRWLIPEALPGRTMEDSVTSRLNYARLDDPSSAARIRLNSTVVLVRHDGKPGRAKAVDVTYVRDGKAYRVRGHAVVMACYNAIIPYLCPELPETQKTALHMAVRQPIVYTNVAIRNWTAFQKTGTSFITCPGGYHHTINLDFSVSIGTYRCPRTPEEPMVLHLEREPLKPGLPVRDQFRAGRADLLSATFETFERNIRDQLGRALADGGFDSARDIEAITVNRWPHGYAAGQNTLYDPDWSDEELPWIVGRRRFGRIAISNSDAAAICLTQAAFDQSRRAVQEIVTDVMRRQFLYPYSEKV
jgi:spermidine dehydrogenase